METQRMGLAIMAVAASLMAVSVARAQDVPGIEICTVEKTMERRTSCLQSNVDFLKKSLDKVQVDARNRLDAASREIVALKETVATLQKTVGDLKTEVDKAKKPAATSTPAPATPAPSATPPAAQK